MAANTLLVVDESAALCESLDLLLSSYGMTVHTCRSVREARKLATSVTPGAKPPGDDVKSFVTDIKSAGACAVLLMGQDVPRPEAGTLAIESGADGWVDKPFSALTVLKRLRDVQAR